MKNSMFLLLACLLTASLLKAQTLSEVLDNKESSIYYYGIDFTKAKLIGDAKANATDIVDRQFAGLNDLMLNEADKYDIAGAFRRSEISSDLKYVNKRNEKVDPDNLISTDTEDYNHLTESDIATLIKGFDAGGKTGTGLLFVVDGMSKPKKAIAVWATLFDISSKKILKTELIEGKVGMGFSFRNYWATGFKSVIDRIKKSRYAAWKSEG